MGPEPKAILVVEDEPEVRSVLKAMLVDAGFEVLVAKDGASALHQLWKRGGNLALLVTDVDMGRMTGMSLPRRYEPNILLYRSSLSPACPFRRVNWKE